MTLRMVWVVCCVGMLGCGGAHRESEAPGEEKSRSPEASESSASKTGNGRLDIDALRAREAGALTDQKVTGPANAWTAHLAGTGAPLVTLTEGTGVVDAPIGSESDVHCEFYPQDVDPAGMIAQLFATIGAKVKFQTIEPWGVRVVKDAPVLYVRALYLATTAKGKALGEVKLGLYVPTGHPVVCLHDELGYEKTFLELTSKFFESIEHSGPAATVPEYLEIRSAKLGELPVGFSRSRVVRIGDSRVLFDSTALMLPTSVAEVRFLDDISSETLDAKGRLVKGVWAEAVGGKLEMKMEVERQKGPSYRYSGEIDGKPVQGTFKAGNGAGLGTDISVAHSLVGEMKKANGFKIEEQSYSPGLDPTQPTSTIYSRDKSDPAGTAHVSLGKVKFKGHVDELGLFDQMDMPMGAATLNFHRETIRGKP